MSINNHVIGVYLPTGVSTIAFMWIFVKQKNHHKADHYGWIYLIAIAFSIQLPYTGYGGWTVENVPYNSVKLLSIFPIVLLTFHWWIFRTKGTWGKISITWAYLGTFSSMLMADFMLSYHSFDDFNFHGLGGEGFLDALFITPFLASFFALAINSAFKKQSIAKNWQYH